MTDAPPVDPGAEPGDTVIELRNGVPYIGTEPGVKASLDSFWWDEDGDDYRDVTAAFDPGELRDPEGKWIGGALKRLVSGRTGSGTRLSYHGHNADLTKTKGYRVRLKSGEVAYYQHHEHAAEAMRQGRHVPGASDIRKPGTPEPKAEPPKLPPTGEPRVRPLPKLGDKVSVLHGGKRHNATVVEVHNGGEHVVVQLHDMPDYNVYRHHSELKPPVAVKGHPALPRYQRENPLLSVHPGDEGHPTVKRHLTEYGHLPEGVRRLLGQRQVPVVFGARPVSELGELKPYLAHKKVGGSYGEVAGFDQCAGVHTTGIPGRANGYLGIGNGAASYLSANMPAHEAAHALDHNTGFSSGSIQYRDVFGTAQVLYGKRIAPHFNTAVEGEAAARREFFAETYAAWVEAQRLGVSEQAAAEQMMRSVTSLPSETAVGPAGIRIGKALARLYAHLTAEAEQLANKGQ